MRIAFFSSEVVPFAKTGGLADVCGSLPLALEKLGAEMVVFLPRYQCIVPSKFQLKRLNSSVWTTVIGDNVQVYFIENEKYFDRAGLYGNSEGDYPDNLERYQFFCAKSLEVLKQLNLKIDIAHCHDWQTALVPAYLKFLHAKDPFFAGVKSVLTIHNLAYQGVFPKERYPLLGLEEKLFNSEGFEFYDQINFLKAGIVFSDSVTTVSNTYAKDILGERLGCGLHGVLRTRKDEVAGILNGIDAETWDPATDPLIAERFTRDDPGGKIKNKRKLQELSQLPVLDDVPLLGFVGRLSHQKGIDLIYDAMQDLMSMDLQLVVKGLGEGKYHAMLRALQHRFPDKFALHIIFDENLAHQVYAGSDIFLMPSVYEPCGLSQMISLKYGTIPLVHHTGGLVDTIRPYDQGGNGFVFQDYSLKDFLHAVREAVKIYHRKTVFAGLVKKAFDCHFTWDDSARQYMDLYTRRLASETR
ncbi:MAG: glycogen synthase GlgA [Candidatus Omnitrophota bacterium]|nr:glycogen synthase GlgA [Candidatus Omnitrophota bacterium]MDZ4242955.1 glycogen synthase GlgA [Candidatus Omnitrophota bacterium]